MAPDRGLHLYGWMADGVDYGELSAIGDYLRVTYHLSTIADMQGDIMKNAAHMSEVLRGRNMCLGTQLQRCERATTDAASRCKRLEEETSAKHRRELAAA